MAYLTGRLPAIWAVLLNAVAAYLLFTVLHDARTVPRIRATAGNLVLGRICGAVLTLAWPLFHAVRHAHHAHTNDRQRDPDLIVSRAPLPDAELR